VTKKGYYQHGAGSTSFTQGVAALAAGKAVQYPMLGFALAGLPKDQLANLGFFGIPGDDATSAGATVWEPGGAYIPKSSKHIAEAKKFLAFTASPAGTAVEAAAVPPTGPYLVTGSTLPADAPQAAKDLQAYLDSKATSPALEFLSPIKGPSLEQITTAVATGQTSADKAASQYDSDVTKQAKQLGLPGW
jgi:raffinose/stachyose/melibiose transport system substrate-binding protein